MIRNCRMSSRRSFPETPIRTQPALLSRRVPSGCGILTMISRLKQKSPSCSKEGAKLCPEWTDSAASGVPAHPRPSRRAAIERSGRRTST